MASARQTPISAQKFGHIAARLRREMKERGWSSTELAKAIGGSSGLVSPWTRGVAQPGPESRKKLVALLGGPEEDFMARELPDTPPDLPAPRPNGAARATIGRPPTRNRVFSFAINTDGTAHVTLDLQTTTAKAMEILQFLMNAGIDQEAASEESE